MGKRIIIILVSLLFLSPIVSLLPVGQCDGAQNSLIVVDNEGDGDFLTISDAYDHAKPGDHIKIYSGMYNETLIIDKDGIILEGIDHELGMGIDDEHPIINGCKSGNVIEVYADNCMIQGIIVQYSGADFFDAGIILFGDNNIIDGNGIWGNRYGIILNNCSKNHIKNNMIVSNRMDGMYLLFTSENIITSNIIKENEFQGMFLLETFHTTINENTIYLNGQDGIQLRNHCTQVRIEQNNIYSNNIDGIKLMGSENKKNQILKNNVYSNRWNGIHIMAGYDNKIDENLIELNHHNGVHLGPANDTMIRRNTVRDNGNNGIECLSIFAQHNLIYYNNILDSVFDLGQNTWNDPIGTAGNYWASYTGVDEDDDGIGETPYEIAGIGNIDNYPRVVQFSAPSIPKKPSGSSRGSVGTSYHYRTNASDTMVDRIQYGWDWDGDFFVDEWTAFYESDQLCETIHSWDQNGTYIIRVKAMDNHGFQSDWSDPLSVTMPKQRYGRITGIFETIKMIFGVFNSWFFTVVFGW